MAAKQVGGSTTTVTPDQTTEPKVQEEAPVTMDEPNPSKKELPDLIGAIVTQVMKDRASLNRAYSDLVIWYDSQPLENRKELVQKVKKELEAAKMITEALYGHFIMTSQKDL